MMPVRPIETIVLDPGIESILNGVIDRADPGGHGPLMVMGLERALDSTAKQHPILHGLNLSRPEWPKKLPRQVVFWLPEYALGILGREAPDFADWQSGTYFFLGRTDDSIEARDVGGPSRGPRPDVDLPVPNLRARERRDVELGSRLSSVTNNDSPEVLVARSRWLSELGRIALVDGRFEDAERFHLESLDLGERIGQEQPIAAQLTNLAGVYEARGEYLRAEETLARAIEIHQTLGDNSALGTDLANLGNLAFRQSKLERAEQLYRRALGLVEQVEDVGEVARITSNLAAVFREGGRLDESAEALQRSREMFRLLGDKLGEATVAGSFGLLAMDRGDYLQAEAFLQEAMALDRELGRPVGVASRLAGLGVVAARQGRFDEAIGRLREALVVFEEVGDPHGQAECWANLGAVYYAQLNLEAAREAWLRAEALYLQLNLGMKASEIRTRLATLPGDPAPPTEPASADS